MHYKLCIILVLALLPNALTAFAQPLQPKDSLIIAERIAMAEADWVPTGVWPFLNRKFRQGTVVTGFVREVKNEVFCNIHIGKHTVWYFKGETLMEALPGTVKRVEVSGNVYVPMPDEKFGRIVRQDTIDGKMARVICVQTVDEAEMKRRGEDVSHLGSFTLSGDFGSIGLDLINSYDAHPEEKPLPIKNTFYFVYNGDVFECTTKNILAHINPARKNEYRAFTRSAEIISSQESSIQKIWKEFFLKR